MHEARLIGWSPESSWLKSQEYLAFISSESSIKKGLLYLNKQEPLAPGRRAWRVG